MNLAPAFGEIQAIAILTFALLLVIAARDAACHYPNVVPAPEAPAQTSRDDAGWKIVLYGLLVLQGLSILAFCNDRILHFKLPLPFAISHPMVGAISLLGTLLWCSESAIVRPHLTRFAIRSILVALLLWIACIVILPFRQPNKSGERIADATRAFHELVAEQKLPAPASEPEISRDGHHGEFVSIRYRDASGQELRFLASITHERLWQFQSPANRKKITAPALY